MLPKDGAETKAWMQYHSKGLPFRHRQLSPDSFVAISDSGDHAFLNSAEIDMLRSDPEQMPIELRTTLRARYFVGSPVEQGGLARLLASRRLEKRSTVNSGVSLHLIVPTLQCAHSCQYCQVSRSLTDLNHTMAPDILTRSCETIFESPAKNLTVEFQGGDPLVRFDLVRDAVLKIQEINRTENRNVRFVVASTLHQLNASMCAFFKEHGVFLSTSIDGPRPLHNKNRPTPTRDAYERTVAGIELARSLIGPDAVSALMTTTKASLDQPEDIVDEYVKLGFKDIFLRQLSLYGFAKKNQTSQGYTHTEFSSFYKRAIARIVEWNKRGVELREVYASIVLNKMLSPFDAGYVDLQSPTGAGTSVLVYNYDGFVYPSDEARMLAETGDKSLRLGPIGTPMAELLTCSTQRALVEASLVDNNASCRDCAYNLFCAPNPVDSLAQYGNIHTEPAGTDHCNRHKWFFDHFFGELKLGDDWLLDLLYRWAQPNQQRRTQ